MHSVAREFTISTFCVSRKILILNWPLDGVVWSMHVPNGHPACTQSSIEDSNSVWKEEEGDAGGFRRG